jgi:glycosyltransferase involved in cell wall biosynthesis
MGTDCTLVIATVVGREAVLERALASAAGQGFAAVEVEMDLGRTGPAGARNRALSRVRTPLAAVMDDDDVLLPGHLAVLAGALERHPGAVLAFPACTVQDRPVPAAWLRRWAVPFPEAAAGGRLLRENWVPVTTVFRTGAVRAVGGYPEGGGGPEDWGMLKALVARYGAEAVVGPGDPDGPGAGPTWVYMTDTPSTMDGGRFRP